MSQTSRSREYIIVARLAVLITLVLGWELAGQLSPKFAFFLGAPTTVLREFWQLFANDHLPQHFLITAGEAILGLIIGMTLGTTAGLSLWYSKTVSEVAHPFVVAAGAIPIFAFAPIMIVWFGIGFFMKVMLAVFATFFIAFNQAHVGAVIISKEYIEMLHGFRATNSGIFFKAVVPGSFDWVLNSMRLNVGFALMGAFIGEFISAERGLGFLILRAAGLYNMPRAMAAATGLVALALILDFLARRIEARRYSLVQLVSVPRILWRGNSH